MIILLLHYPPICLLINPTFSNPFMIFPLHLPFLPLMILLLPLFNLQHHHSTLNNSCINLPPSLLHVSNENPMLLTVIELLNFSPPIHLRGLPHHKRRCSVMFLI